jgi:hypothetical protein
MISDDVPGSSRDLNPGEVGLQHAFVYAVPPRSGNPPQLTPLGDSVLHRLESRFTDGNLGPLVNVAS